MFPEWSKWDEKDLARYVNPDAVNLLGKLPENPFDMPEDPDGRKRILELIYNKLLESGISYALEKFSYADDVQKIRAPGEVLNGAARGTCLDLSLLFAGLAEGYDLVPVVVLTDGHAFVIVSVKNGRREWDSFGRSELEQFSEPVKDIEVLRQQVNDGSYLAIECTGFAASEKLRDNPDEAFPETLGRDEKGLMPFEQALVSGKAQLFDRQEGLGFALDITVAHRHKEPIEIGEATSIVSGRERTEAVTEDTAHGKASVAAAGEEQVELDMRSEHGAKVHPATKEEGPTTFELPIPVRPRVKPLKGLVGRDTEKGVIRAAMADEETVGVHSGKGWGKTALMRSIAYADNDEFPDGVVYLKVPSQPIADVLQDLHDQFYRADEPAKPSDSTIKQRLADKKAVVILDDLGMDSDSVEDLTFALPESFFVLVSETPSPFGEARPLKLEGLSADDALYFLGKRLGREIAVEEKDAAKELCKTLENHPGHLIEAGNAVLGGQSLAEVARSYHGAAEPSAEMADAVRADLSRIQQKVADILAVAQVPVSLALLERVLADDLTGVPDALHDAIRALIASDRVEAHSPRYSLAATLAEGAQGHWDPADWMEALLSNLADWSESEEVTNDEINRDRQFILRALEWGVEAEKWTEVVRVAKAVDRGIALGRHWGAWEQVLGHALEAGERLGTAGESARAWALHQLGSRAIGIGDDATALQHLTEALEIRERLGETDAVKVTRHNLNLVTPAPPIPGRTLGALLGALVLMLVIPAAVAGWTNAVQFDPGELTFSNIPIGASETKSIELVNPTDRDISGIQLSVSSPTGEFALGDPGSAGDAAPTDAAGFGALDMPLAAAYPVAAGAGERCELGADNVLDLPKKTRCSLAVVYTPSQPGLAMGTLRAGVGDDAIDAVLQVSGPPTTTTEPPPTTAEPPPTTEATTPTEATTTTGPTTTTEATTTTTEPPSLAIIDIAHEITVFESDSPQQILVTNVGTAPVTIERLVQPDHFSADGCVGDPLGAGESCTLTVTFTGSSGLYCEILELEYDGAGERQVFLKGGD